MTKLVTKDSLQHMLNNPNPVKLKAVIGRALVGIFNRQTEDEKKVNETRVHNNIGFTGADGRSGAITAKYYLKHHDLQDWQIQLWTKRNAKGYSRLTKYHAQLNEIAEAKAANK